eukprot:c12092_g2_i2.p1 GENE.c12092_g2_i2~~c12092_g2_i2.p1  ORF type:complete len:547 (-),score=152.27 c12092_g2_i2:108-1748(-)
MVLCTRIWSSLTHFAIFTPLLASCVPDPKKPRSSDVFGYPAAFLAKLLTPKVSLCNDVFELTVGDHCFVCYPCHIKSQLDSCFNSTMSSMFLSPDDSVGGPVGWAELPPPKNTRAVSVFNLVLVLRSQSPHIQGCRNVVTKVATALKHEEERKNFVTSQVQRMLDIRDQISRLQATDSHMVHQQQLHCSLASTLKQIFDGLNNHSQATVRINNWVNVSVQIDTNATSASHLLSPNTNTNTTQNNNTNNSNNNSIVMSTAMSTTLTSTISSSASTHGSLSSTERLGSVKGDGGRLQPYHTLLLLQSEEAVLVSLARDSNPALRRLISACAASQGHKSFRELAIDTGIDLSRLYTMSRHLMYWHKAIITHTMVKHNMYMLAHTLPPIHNNSRLDLAFLHDFAKCNISLANLLSRYFAAPARAADIMNEFPKPESMNLIPWLLGHGLLQPLLTYVQYIPPSSGEEDILTDSSMFGSGMGVPQSEHRLLLANFERVREMFDGLHHVDEVIYESSLSRDEVNCVTQHFDNVLVTSLHPDVEVTRHLPDDMQ